MEILVWWPGDDEAKRRGVQKSILERAAPPTFDVCVEMLERGRWRVHVDVAAAVDALLAGEGCSGSGSTLGLWRMRMAYCDPVSEANLGFSAGDFCVCLVYIAVLGVISMRLSCGWLGLDVW